MVNNEEDERDDDFGNDDCDDNSPSEFSVDLVVCFEEKSEAIDCANLVSDVLASDKMFELVLVSVTESVVWSVGKDNGSSDDDRLDCEDVNVNDEEEEDVDADHDNSKGEREVLSSVTEVYVTAESAFVNVETVC